jgi:hypothetical protein
MEINLEIFYDRDDDKKIVALKHVLENLQMQEEEVTHLSRLFLKCIFRVLRDDYRNNMDLTRTALKTLLYLFKNGERILVQENEQSLLGDIIQENPLEQFLLLAKRIFSWEFKRLSKTVTRSQKDQLVETEIQTYNLTLAKQAQIFSLLILVMKEYMDLKPSSFHTEEDDLHQRENDTHHLIERVALIDEHGIIESLLKCMDHSDITLNRTVTSFLKDYMSPPLAKRLVELHLFLRLAPCLQEKSFDHRYHLMIQWLSSEGVLVSFKDQDAQLLVSHLRDGLIKGHKESVLIMLNFLSVDEDFRSLLVEAKIQLYLLSLSLQFLKKPDKVVLQKKVLWNLLINMSLNKDFSLHLIKTDKLGNFFDKFLSNPQKWLCILKFLENLFHFASRDPGFVVPSTLAHYVEDIIQLLENSYSLQEDIHPPIISGCMWLLSVFKPKPDEGLLKMCQYYLLELENQPNCRISTLVFLNRVSFVNLDAFPEMSLPMIISLVLESLNSEELPDDETYFQVLQFLCNLLGLLVSAPNESEKGNMLKTTFEEGLSLNVLSDFLRRFQTKSFRFLCLALRFFDLLAVFFGKLSLKEESQVSEIVREIQLIKIGFYLDAMREREDQLSPKSLESDEDLDYEDYLMNQFY